MDGTEKANTWEVATLGGGCFWCLEAVFSDLRGVVKVVSGYSGGALASPSYEQVCTGQTGHAEVVQVTFDTSQITFGDILRIFFAIHNPTSLNRQGADVGPQYRSVIFVHSAEQESTAIAIIKEMDEAQLWDAPIVTEVVPFEAFYPAEEYHAAYFQRHPLQPYCQAVIAPKVVKFRKQFAGMLKS